MEDKIFYKKQKLRPIDILGIVGLIVFILGITTAVEVTIGRTKERKQSLEEIGRLVKSDSHEYELEKVEAFGHEFITFHEIGCFGVVHSPDCLCHNADKSELK